MKESAICYGNSGHQRKFLGEWQVLLRAAEAAEVILLEDDIIKAAPRKRVPDHSLVKLPYKGLCSGPVHINGFSRTSTS